MAKKKTIAASKSDKKPKAKKSKEEAMTKKAPATIDSSSEDDFVPISDGADIQDERPEHVEKQNVDAPVESGGFYPTLKLLQDLSPEVDEDEEVYVPGAEVGDFVVTDGTNQVLLDGKEGLNFIPLAVIKRWVEWIPRKQGGGFVASYNSREDMEAQVSPGNEVQVSIDYLVCTRDLSDDGELAVCVIQFNSATKLGVARILANHIKNFQTMYGVSYNIHAVKKKNRANQKYYNFGIKVNGWVKEALYGALQKMVDEYSPTFLEGPRSSSSSDDDDEM